MTDKLNSKIISEKALYESKYFKVIEKTVEVNSKIFKKEFLQRRSVVLIAPISSQNEIYLAYQYREAIGKKSLELIAGTLDDSEEPLVAAKRELSEESGIQAKTWNHLSTMHLSANMIAIVDVYLAKDIEVGKAHQDADEQIEIIKIPLEVAVEKVMSGEINVSIHVAAILLLANLQKQGKI